VLYGGAYSSPQTPNWIYRVGWQRVAMKYVGKGGERMTVEDRIEAGRKLNKKLK